MSDLFNTIRSIIRAELKQLRTAELGVVQEQHPHNEGNYACTVVLRNAQIVLPKVPVATSRIGVASIPNVGDLVLVQFMNGDINAPVITGCLYNDEDRPPEYADKQWVAQLPLGASDSDAVQVQMQAGDERKVTLQLGDALKINCRDDDPILVIEVDGGKATLQIDRDGAVTLQSQGKLRLNGNEVAVKGSTIEVAADGELNLKGAVINLN